MTPSRAAKPSDVSRAFYHYSHSVGLNHGDRCLPGDEFAFGDYIDDVIGKPRFTTGS